MCAHVVVRQECEQDGTNLILDYTDIFLTVGRGGRGFSTSYSLISDYTHKCLTVRGVGCHKKAPETTNPHYGIHAIKVKDIF